MAIWTEKTAVNSHDVDSYGIVRPSALLRYAQEMASRQCHFCPPTTEEMLENGMGFILSRVVMISHFPLRAYDEIEAQTWPLPTEGARFFRNFRLLREGKVAAEFSTLWALVNIESRRLLRVSSLPSYPNTDDETVSADAGTAIRIPDGIALEHRGDYTVRYGDTDGYRHMNNTRYPDMICGFLTDFDGRRVTKLSISYLSEAPFGRTFEVYASAPDENGTYYFRSIIDGKKGIDAIVESVRE